MVRTVLLALGAAACSPSSTDTDTGGGDSGWTDDSAADTSGDTDDAVTCAQPNASSCGDSASVIGVVVWAGDEGPTTGDLVIYVTHLDLGQGNEGGYYHHSVVAPGVDLAAGPVVAEIDMCDGGEMWSKDYGDYNLLAILDQDGNNQPDSFDSDRTPDKDEPSARVSPVSMVPGAPSQCVDDVVLDCLDGRSCTAY